MFVASDRRKNNVAEYLLYMWQIEDIIRANRLDMDLIRRNVIDPSGLDDARKHQLEEWYESLIDMMRREGVEKSGHLQINRNMMADLVDLHRALMADARFPEYTAEFYRTLPYIVELRAKAGEEKADEVETCFNALYGMLMLRLQGREISPQTQQAITQISKMIALLAKDYHLNEQGLLFKDDDTEAPA